MIKYIVYNNDGIILRTGTCLESDMHLQCGTDEYIMEGEADDVTQKILDGNIVDKPESPPSNEELASECLERLRIKRDFLLNSSDYTQFPDAPLTDEKKSQWVLYRQQLRDLPSEYTGETNIKNVIFPTKPR